MKKRICIFAVSMLMSATILAGCGRSDSLGQMDGLIENEQVTDILDNSQEELSELNSEASVSNSDENAAVEECYDVIPENYAYSLTVSINPLVELYFDEDNTIIGIAYLNQDAVDAYKDTEIIGHTLNEGIEKIVTAAATQGYLKDEATVEIKLAKVDEELADTFDAAVLIEASQAANETIANINNEEGSSLNAGVELSVSNDVTEHIGVSAPVICTACNGTGNSCAECSGTGIVNCKRCSGGVETCGICHGSAVITCHGCHGAGGDCGHCGGTGRISCDACGGAGTFSCSWCGGALRHVCPECWGEGSCATCGGDGVM